MMKQQMFRIIAMTVAALALAGACTAGETKVFPISGKAFKPDGSPAAGAVVEARVTERETDWVTKAKATSGTDGQFTLQLPPGNYYVNAVLGDFISYDWSKTLDVPADGKISTPFIVRLEGGCRIDGSVIDISNEQPVAGVRVITDGGDRTVSSESGNWTMLLPKRNSSITAIKSGYWWPLMNLSCTGDSMSVRVETKPGGAIKGRVIDQNGQPVSGARIWGQNRGHFRALSTKADADGRFVLEGQNPDAKATVSARAEGYEYDQGQDVTFATGQREMQVEIRIEKMRLRKITGRVAKQDGSPVEGATVGYGWGTSYSDYASVQTGKDGRYTLDANVLPSLIVVSHPGMAPAWKHAEPTKDLHMDFRLKPGHSVEGSVEDEDGKPLAGAWVSAAMPVQNAETCDNMYSITGTTTGKDGKFKLDNLPEGEVYTDVYCADHSRLENERLKVDRKDYTLVMRKSEAQNGTISGTAVRHSDGKPVTDFNVRIDTRRSGYGESVTLTDEGVTFHAADGHFSMGDLRCDKPYFVVVTAPGYMRASSEPIVAKPVNTQSGGVIRLRGAGDFEGRVTEAATGNPIEGVTVTAWDTAGAGAHSSISWNMNNSGWKSVSTSTGADGKFVFKSVPFPGGAIQLEKPGFGRMWVRTIRFSKPLQATMEKSATITGTVPVQPGTTPGGRINFENIDLRIYSYGMRTAIQPDGSFRIEDLPAGEYFVSYTPQGGNTSTLHQTLELKPGETYQVDWAKQGPIVLEGKVLRNGKPVLNAEVSLNFRRQGWNVGWAGETKTGKDGSYRLTVLKPGSYHVSCMLGEWMDPNHDYFPKTMEFSASANRLDFHLPYGSISGKMVETSTGKPVKNASIRLYVFQTSEQRMGFGSSDLAEVGPRWWPANECKTDSKGFFSVKNLKPGKWMVCATYDSGQRATIPTAVVNLANGEAKTGVLAKVGATGSASAIIPKMTMAVCVDQRGMVYSGQYDQETGWSGEFENLPVGKMKLVVQGPDYVTAEIPFVVREDETTKVPVKLDKGGKLVFRPKDEPFADPASASIAFRITTPDGKPAWVQSGRPAWGAVLDGYSLSSSITVKPGVYHLEAGVRQGRDSWDSDSKLTGFVGAVRVTAGKDTVVDVDWDESEE